MGAVCGRPDRSLRSKFGHEEVEEISRSIVEVRVRIPRSKISLPCGVDWSGLVRGCLQELQIEEKLYGIPWLDNLLACALVTAKTNCIELRERNPNSTISWMTIRASSHRHELVTLSWEFDGWPGSFLRMKDVKGDALMRLLAKHPLVTSLHGREDDSSTGCAILVGFDSNFWKIFDPAASLVYNVPKDRPNCGIGDLIFVPIS